MRSFLKVVLIFVFGLLLGGETFAQSVVVPFTARTSAKAPAPYQGKTIYNVQGDFTMLGNTNLTLVSYSNTGSNNADMKYVDVDNDASTWNSSSATLKLGDADPRCSEILFAGLYWTGRAHDLDASGVSNSPNIFSVTKNSVTKEFNKRKIKLKKAGGTYQQIEAGTNDIYYPTTTGGAMYSAYADVTDYVRANGVGEYTVADIAVREGAGGATGFYGGWSMVVIFKNPTMKWRDISVFDGHGYMTSNGGTVELPISGFRTAQSGDINVKLGVTAGEGDIGVTGDYFEIRNAANNAWIRLNHANNAPSGTTPNFFNSSIFTGGNARNPNFTNNTGLDVSMFDLNNTDKILIGNNATSTRFRYGTNGDTYIIFNIVLAVDAYVPQIVVENKPTDTNISNGGTVSAGNIIEFTSTIKNRGTEAVNNGVVTIHLPANVYYEGTSTGGLPTGTTIGWTAPVGALPGATPQTTPGGTLAWNVGTIPLSTNTETILHTLKYNVRVTNDCILLNTGGLCALQINVDGNFTGLGANSNTPANTGLVSGYNADCANTPIYGPFKSTIDVSSVSCSEENITQEGFKRFVVLCEGTAIPRVEITTKYPPGTTFYNGIPGTPGVSVVSGDFQLNITGNTATKFYARVLGMEDGCYLKLETYLDKIITQPTVKDQRACSDSPITISGISVSAAGAAVGNKLYYFTTSTGGIGSTTAPTPIGEGTFIYYAAEGNDKGCFGTRVPFSMTIVRCNVITNPMLPSKVR
ncbi:hypothetical protein [Sphingobacterium olei]|nr:hypothetical protein [Sphingobacterium olei]